MFVSPSSAALSPTFSPVLLAASSAAPEINIDHLITATDLAPDNPQQPATTEQQKDKRKDIEEETASEEEYNEGLGRQKRKRCHGDPSFGSKLKLSSGRFHPKSVEQDDPALRTLEDSLLAAHLTEGDDVADEEEEEEEEKEVQDRTAATEEEAKKAVIKQREEHQDKNTTSTAPEAGASSPVTTEMKRDQSEKHQQGQQQEQPQVEQLKQDDDRDDAVVIGFHIPPVEDVLRLSEMGGIEVRLLVESEELDIPEQEVHPRRRRRRRRRRERPSNS